MADEKTKFTIRSIDFYSTRIILGLGPVSTLTQGQSGLRLRDSTQDRCVYVTGESSKDYVKVPYEAISGIRYTPVESQV